MTFEAPAGGTSMTTGKRVVGLTVMALLVALVGALVDRCVIEARTSAARETSEQQSATIVSAVRNLARLETVSFHVERVIDLRDRQSRLFGLLEVEDALLLVASADVVAGVDLSHLSSREIQVDEKTRAARIRLPRPEIFGTRIDNEHTYVHTRTTEVLAKRREDLESRARREAERTLEQAALDGGILTRAKANAAQAVEALALSLGCRNVAIEWSE